ncbi:MAG TPA: Ig-like domain-containing protein, partial [Solirubrobacter sp.]|nr:Ig-like domain-containing protein [Solirubrobacter sp.]
TTVGAAVTVQDAVATLPTAAMAAGPHTVTARSVSDDAAFANSSGMVAHAVGKWSSQSAVTVRPDPTVAGQSATFTATVTGQASDGHRPTGTVTFRDDDGSSFATAPVNAQGVARTDAVVGAGVYRVHADYSGDGHYAPSSASVSQTINRAATVTTLTSSANPVVPGGTVTFTASVEIVEPGDVAPYGTLQVTVNGEPFGEPVPMEGYDTLTLTVVAPEVERSDDITVSYSGDFNTLPSSDSLTQVVAAPIPVPTTTPTPDATSTLTRADLRRMTSPLISRLKRRGPRALSGARMTATVPSAGTLEVTIRAGLVIARAKRSFAAAGTGRLNLGLTAKGRRQIKRGTLKLTIMTRFTPRGGTPVTLTERVTARRAKARAAWVVTSRAVA